MLLITILLLLAISDTNHDFLFQTNSEAVEKVPLNLEKTFDEAKQAFVDKEYDKTLNLLELIQSTTRGRKFIYDNLHDLTILKVKALRLSGLSHTFYDIFYNKTKNLNAAKKILKEHIEILNTIDGQILFCKISCDIAIDCVDYNIEYPKKVLKDLQNLLKSSANEISLPDLQEFNQYKAQLIQVIIQNQITYVNSILGKHKDNASVVDDIIEEFIADYQNIIEEIDNSKANDLFKKLQNHITSTIEINNENNVAKNTQNNKKTKINWPGNIKGYDIRRQS